MAFIPGSISGTTTKPTGGFVPGSISSKGLVASTSKGFVPGSVAGTGGGSSYKNLDSSNGLYQLAVKNGLQGRADAILAAQQGESTKKIFSGGFITDIFDGLNALQYGVTGMLKGKSFAEGVQTRQSFADKDAMGANGIPGMILGTLMDIAVDPLTYIAPATVFKKIPVLGKALKMGKEAVFGRYVEKAIDEGKDLTTILSKVDTVVPKELETLADSARKSSSVDDFITGEGNRFYRSKEADLVASGKAGFIDLKDFYNKIVNPTIDGIDIPVNADKIIRTFQDVQGGTRLGKYVASKFAYMFGADPVFKSIYERSVKNIAVTTDVVSQLGKSVAKLDVATASKILTKDATGRFIRTGLGKLAKELTPKQLEPVAHLYKVLDDLGKQAVDLGLLSKAKYEEGVGNYIKNAYTEFETAKKKGLFKTVPLGIKGIKSRVEGLTPEAMAKLGQIDNPAYLLFKSVFDLNKDVENAKMLRELAQKFGTKTAREGFTQLPNTKKWGDLAGQFIPKGMQEYLQEIIEPAGSTAAKTLVANFKFFKVVMNPATHARNIISNMILNWWKLGIGPWRLDEYAASINDIARKTPLWQRAVKQGGGLNTFASAEMKDILDGPEALNALKKAGGLWKTTKTKLGNMYQAEENVAKMVAFRNGVKKGLSDEEAWKAAESATFNYAQVTPFVRKLRESMFGMPFITFTIKSTPVVLETALKNPNRISVIGKIKNNIEKLSGLEETEREKASEPSYVKNGFYVKLPMKDKHGRSAYFDLTYILPFGDLLAGNFFERQVNLDTGLKESLPLTAIKKAPFINLVAELGKNKDFYGNSIWKNSDSQEQQLGDLMRHLVKTYSPPLLADQLSGGYNDKGEKQVRGVRGALTRPEDKIAQNRTLMQELLRNVGAKVQPIDVDIQETYAEWNRKKGLQNLGLENGYLNEFNRTYIQK